MPLCETIFPGGKNDKSFWRRFFRKASGDAAFLKKGGTQKLFYDLQDFLRAASESGKRRFLYYENTGAVAFRGFAPDPTKGRGPFDPGLLKRLFQTLQKDKPFITN